MIGPTQGFIYILHFDEKIAHAEHYIGCTQNPMVRFARHAAGGGSRLCRELVSRGIGFRVGSLASCNNTKMRRMERSLKNIRSASDYCGICQKQPRQFPGTRIYPFAFAIKHISGIEGLEDITITVAPCLPVEERMLQIAQIMNDEKDCLGFLPAGPKAASGAITLDSRGCIVYAATPKEVAGYVTFTNNLYKNHVKIHQCVTRDTWRRMGLGRRMVEQVIWSARPSAVICTVRADLSANSFWQSIGFVAQGERKHKTSGSTLIDYRREVLYNERNLPINSEANNVELP